MVSSRLKRLVRGFILVGVGGFASKLLSYGAEVYFARELMAEEFGGAIFAYSFLLTISSLLLFGVPEGVTHYTSVYSRNNEKKQSQLLLISLGFIGVLSLISMGVILISNDTLATVFSRRQSEWITLLSPLLLFYPISRVSLSAVRGYERTIPKIVFDDFLNKVIPLAACLLLIGYTLTPQQVLFPVYYVGQYAFSAIGLVFTTLYISDVTKYTLNELLEGLRDVVEPLVGYSLPLLLKNSFGKLIGNIDIMIVGLLLSSESVGFYRTGFVVVQTEMIILISLYYLYNPIQTGLISGDSGGSAEFYENVTGVAIVATSVATSFLFVNSNSIISILFGERYAPGASVLAILSIDIFLRASFGPVGETLESAKETGIESAVVIGSTVMNVGLNYVLILQFGIIGGAIATTISIFLLNLLRLYSIRKRTGVRVLSLSHFLKCLLLLVSTVLIASALDVFLQMNSLLSLIVQIPIYGVILSIVGVSVCQLLGLIDLLKAATAVRKSVQWDDDDG